MLAQERVHLVANHDASRNSNAKRRSPRQEARGSARGASRSSLRLGGSCRSTGPSRPPSRSGFSVPRKYSSGSRAPSLSRFLCVIAWCALIANTKPGRRRRDPRRHRLLRRHVAEGVVDLDAVQTAGVVLEKPRRRQVLRVEARLPRRVRVPGCARVEGRHRVRPRRPVVGGRQTGGAQRRVLPRRPSALDLPGRRPGKRRRRRCRRRRRQARQRATLGSRHGRRRAGKHQETAGGRRQLRQSDENDEEIDDERPSARGLPAGLEAVRELARQLRVDSIRCVAVGRLRPPHLEPLGGRPDGRPVRPPPALRLEQARPATTTTTSSSPRATPRRCSTRSTRPSA